MSGEPGSFFGTFSEPGNLSIGDPYTKPPATKLPRHTGKQFSIVAPKEGRAPDAYLDKNVRSLGEGAPYVDAWILDRKLSRIPGKPVSSKPFVTLVGRRGDISCGPGSSNGCLSAVPLDTDGSAAARRSNPERQPADKHKNIYTSGPKVGGFGRPWRDRTLGEVPKYYPDVYDGGRLKEKEMAAAAKAVSPKPFVSSGHLGHTFSADAFLSQAAAAAAAAKQEAADEKRGSTAVKPWRSGGPPRTGTAFCVFSQVGRDFVPDPVREAKFQHKAGGVKPFRPVGSCHKRLSVRDINPYTLAARPAPDIDFTLFATG